MEENRNFYVYGLFIEDEDDLVDTCFYVGKGCGNRLDHHWREKNVERSEMENPHKTYKILKAEKNGKNVYSRKIVNDITEEKAFELERKMIEEIGLKYITNMKPGGFASSGENHPMYGKEHSETSKKKMRLAALERYENSEDHPCYNKTGREHPAYGHKHSEEWKNWMSDYMEGSNNPMFGKTGNDNPNFGRKVNEETKSKISDTLEGRFTEEDHPMYEVTGEDHPAYGYKHSEETKKKISSLNQGSGNGNSKLSCEDVKRIKWLLTETSLSQRKISVEFDVSRKCIGNINNEKSWTHVKEKICPDWYNYN